MARETIRPVVFAGENPVMRLYRPGSDDVVALASYWRSTWSEQGEGSALLLWLDPAASGAGAAQHAIFADNAAMAGLVTERFNQYFARFKDHDWVSLEPAPARFSLIVDGSRSYRVLCSSAGASVELAWRSFLDVYQIRAQNEFGSHAFEVTSTICPVAEATIAVDGALVAGEVKREGDRESSAFVAFAETWTGG
jgi:hypothetical protein